MPIFRGQTLYCRASTVDVAFTNVRTNVRALQSTAGVDTDFTITFTSTTEATQTVNPFTNIIDVTDDNRTKLGWAMNQNEASVDSMGSTSTRTRYTPAGDWQFKFAWTSNNPAAFASYNVTISYHVYRVAANGGARTLLFSVNAPTINVNRFVNSADGEVSSGQPEYSFAPNETLFVAVQVTAAASSSFGNTTNTVITFKGATSGSFFVGIPPVGLRSVYHDSSTLLGAGVATMGSLVRKVVSSLADGVGSFLRKLSASRSYSLAGSGVSSFDRNAILSRSFDASGNAVGSFKRTVIFVRTFNANGTATVRPRIALDWDDLPDSGGGTINVYRPLIIFDD